MGGDNLLKNSVIENVLYAALSRGGDFAEVFVEDKRNASIRLVGGLVENNISGRDYGVGVRIFDKYNSIYAYTNDSAENNLVKVAKEAAAALESNQVELRLNLMKRVSTNYNPIDLYPTKIEKNK